MRVYYHVPTVVLSLLAAIFASFVALYIVSRPRMTALHVIGGSLLMGMGIATMHYTGMAAMRLPAMHHYHPGLWLLSVVLAVVISLAALWLTSYFREENQSRLLKIAISIVMGLAIPVMHYTGMASVTYMPVNEAPDLSKAIDISVLANSAIIIITPSSTEGQFPGGGGGQFPWGGFGGKKKGGITPAFHAVTAPWRCARRLLVGPSPGGSVQLLDCLDVSLRAYCRHKKVSRSLRWAHQLVQLCPPARSWEKHGQPKPWSIPTIRWCAGR